MADTSPSYPNYCHWDLAGSSDAGYILGEIQPELSYIKSVIANAGGSDAVDLTVSGRDAVYYPSPRLSSLWVDIGGQRTLTLQFNQGDYDLGYFQPIAVQLAEIALSRLRLLESTSGDP